FWGEYNSGYGVDRFTNVVNALAAYQGLPHFEWSEMADVKAAHHAGEDAVLPTRGITVRRFANHNVHVFFEKWTLLDINRALAEFYGEVLPDAEEEGVKPSQSTAVSK